MFDKLLSWIAYSSELVENLHDELELLENEVEQLEYTIEDKDGYIEDLQEDLELYKDMYSDLNIAYDELEKELYG